MTPSTIDQEPSLQSVQTRSSGPDVETILGAVKTNPYSVANMTTAWNNITGSNLSSISPTHKYIKFTPVDDDQLVLLANKDDIDVVDFPLNREIVLMGDYYIQSGKDIEDIPDFYTTVSADYVFKNDVPYTVLEDLIIPPYETYLTAEAFRLVDADYDVPIKSTSSGGGSGGGSLGFPDCDISCNGYPCCLLDENIKCEDPAFCELPYDCDPTSLDWPNCLFPDTGNTGGGPTNDCGCSIAANRKEPGGCVRMEDTQFNDPVPVRNAKIIWYDGYFNFKRTFTDDNGCWRLLGYREGGRGYMTLKFKNDKVKVSSIRGARLWQYFFAVDDFIGTFQKPFNNINHLVVNSTNVHSGAKRRWAAATVVNAREEFSDFLESENVTELSLKLKGLNQLKFLLVDWDLGFAAGAPMLRHQFQSSVVDDIVELVLAAAGFPVVSVAHNIMKKELPDIVFPYDDDASDVAKVIIFHELGHAIHWANAGEAYYNQIRVHEVVHQLENGEPYGTPGNFSNIFAVPDIIAFAEAWGEHHGLFIADQAYGANHSNFNAFDTWIRRLELTRFENDFIAEGLFWDLIDNVVDVNPAVTDNVSGFTYEQIFQFMTSQSNNKEDIENGLIQNFLGTTPNTVIQVNQLFDSYNF